jgi:hypothetical protein
MANNFQNGPGGRLVKAQADATSVNRDPRPNGPYIVQYDKIDWANPFDWKLGVVKGLKKANTFFGGDIERTGYDRESYGDVINRLEQTPGTVQYLAKNAPKIPNIQSPLAGPANVGINALNAIVGPGNNRGAAAVGEVVLDPVNYMVGAAARGLQLGLPAVSQMANLGPKAAQALKTIGNAAPWVDRGNDVAEGVTEYRKYPTKPKFEKKEKEMTPQQKEFLEKLSRYRFANVK